MKNFKKKTKHTLVEYKKKFQNMFSGNIFKLNYDRINDQIYINWEKV